MSRLLFIALIIGLSCCINMSKSVMMALTERKRASMLGLYIADAVAMPVHWMYDLRQLSADYGVITGYAKPKDKFQGSIMNLSNTGGGGRGGFNGDIIGDVINKGKKKYWQRGGNNHYHIGLHAGENTLEAHLARLLSRSIATNSGSFDKVGFLQEYATFMTTEGSHPDTYAATAHRMFFANYVQDKPLTECADNDGHNTDAIDALTLCVPAIVNSYTGQEGAARDVVKKEAAAAAALFRKSSHLSKYVIVRSED